MSEEKPVVFCDHAENEGSCKCQAKNPGLFTKIRRESGGYTAQPLIILAAKQPAATVTFHRPCGYEYPENEIEQHARSESAKRQDGEDDPHQGRVDIEIS